MKFTAIGEYTVKIVLDGDDMEKYGVCYDGMDYSDTHTRRVIWEILDAAKAKTGFDAGSDRLHIQVYPTSHGGCEMYISKLGTGARGGRGTYAFAELDPLLSALRSLDATGDLRTCRVYSQGETWYLSAPRPDVASEFLGKLCPPMTEAWLSEHADAIIDTPAVRELLHSFYP